MTGLIGLLAFIAFALIAWGIAEAKYKNITYEHSEAEKEEAALLEEERKEHGDKEMNIRDVIKNISCKGYKAV